MTSCVRKCAWSCLVLLSTLVWITARNVLAQESLTVSALPSAVSLNLAPGGEAVAPVPVTITTTWILGVTRLTVNLYASFSSSPAALTDGLGHNIPSASVLGQVTTGAPTIFTAFTQTGPFGGAGADLKLFSQGIGVSNRTGLRSDNLILKIDLTSVPIPAGIYLGTLNIQAQAL